MPATNSKPTSEELDQAKKLYNDMNEFLGYLSGKIESEIQELAEDDDSDDDEEELSPVVYQFLKEFKEYQVHTQQQTLGSDDSSCSSVSSNKKYSRLPRHLLSYSKTYQTLQLLSPDLLSHQKLCDAKIDSDVRVSPLFSSSSPIPDLKGNEKLLTNGSPSVSLLKAQLEKIKKEQEMNYIVIRPSTYTPIREKKFIFVVEKSTAAPQPQPIEPHKHLEPPKQQQEEQEPIKEEVNSTTKDEKSELVKEILSEKKTKKSAIDFDFLSKFLASTKLGFSGSQLRTLWT